MAGSRLPALAAIFLALASAACAKSLIAQPIEKQADGWMVRLDSMTEGGNAPPLGAGVLTVGTIYEPPDGHRFLHLFLKIRNDATAKRTFRYDACDLDLGDAHVTPAVITNYNGPVRQIDTTESYDGGEESPRWLIFSYPDGRYPTRFRCGGATIDLPPLGPAGAAKQ
jgi:hypothetical protein